MSTKGFLAPLIPKKCPICGAFRKKGDYPKDNRFQPDLKVYYRCGAIVSVRKVISKNSFSIDVEECWCADNIKKSEVNLEFAGRNGYLFEGCFVFEGNKAKRPRKHFSEISENKPLRQTHYYALIDPKLSFFPFYEKIDEKLVKIHYGVGVLALFTKWCDANDYGDNVASYLKKKEGVDFIVERLSLTNIHRIAIEKFSHVVVDPNLRHRIFRDSDLSDLTDLLL